MCYCFSFLKMPYLSGVRTGNTNIVWQRQLKALSLCHQYSMNLYDENTANNWSFYAMTTQNEASPALLTPLSPTPATLPGMFFSEHVLRNLRVPTQIWNEKMIETQLNKVNIKKLHQMRQGIHRSNNFEHYFNGCEDDYFKQVHDGTGQRYSSASLIRKRGWQHWKNWSFKWLLCIKWRRSI